MNEQGPGQTNKISVLPGVIAVMALGYILLHSLFGGTLLAYNQWDSYALQAEAWLQGRMDLGRDYSWLELAIYNGKYYLSFPPLPSAALLPLVMLMGAEIPSNLISAAYAMGTAAFAYKALRLKKMEDMKAAFLSIAYVWGSNMLWMSTSGGVWFQAQGLNMLLLTGAVYYALKDNSVAAYALAALAVGCRPFSVLAFLPLGAHFILARREEPMRTMAKKQLVSLIIPAIIAAALMWYNWKRFGNPMEFGHNYLPEFTSSERGQFSLSYILPNLYNVLLRPIGLAGDMSLEYPIFDGFMFYIANPMFLLWIWAVMQDIAGKRADLFAAAAITATAAELVLLCAHKTMGGWQFGVRYTVDMLPAAFMYLLRGGHEPGRAGILIMTMGVMLNLYGALAMNFLH